MIYEAKINVFIWFKFSFTSRGIISGRLHFSTHTAGCILDCGPGICSCGLAAKTTGRLQISIHLICAIMLNTDNDIFCENSCKLTANICCLS